jgi:hypothetical protein
MIHLVVTDLPCTKKNPKTTIVACFEFGVVVPDFDFDPAPAFRDRRQQFDHGKGRRTDDQSFITHPDLGDTLADAEVVWGYFTYWPNDIDRFSRTQVPESGHRSPLEPTVRVRGQIAQPTREDRPEPNHCRSTTYPPRPADAGMPVKVSSQFAGSPVPLPRCHRETPPDNPREIAIFRAPPGFWEYDGRAGLPATLWERA